MELGWLFLDFRIDPEFGLSCSTLCSGIFKDPLAVWGVSSHLKDAFAFLGSFRILKDFSRILDDCWPMFWNFKRILAGLDWILSFGLLQIRRILRDLLTGSDGIFQKFAGFSHRFWQFNGNEPETKGFSRIGLDSLTSYIIFHTTIPKRKNVAGSDRISLIKTTES